MYTAPCGLPSCCSYGAPMARSVTVRTYLIEHCSGWVIKWRGERMHQSKAEHHHALAFWDPSRSGLPHTHLDASSLFCFPHECFFRVQSAQILPFISVLALSRWSRRLSLSSLKSVTIIIIIVTVTMLPRTESYAINLISSWFYFISMRHPVHLMAQATFRSPCTDNRNVNQQCPSCWYSCSSHSFTTKSSIRWDRKPNLNLCCSFVFCK